MMTCSVNIYTARMGRWKPGAPARLERAALELFTERGFAATTVPEIAARAGLTTRTFFRHFADKREVLFAHEQDLPTLVERLMAEAPEPLGPVAVIAYGLEQLAATVFADTAVRSALRARRAIIEADQGLRERELQKRARLSEAGRQGFLRRGADGLTATLAAELAVTVFSVALARWLDGEDERELSELFAETLRALRTVTADAPVPTPSN